MDDRFDRIRREAHAAIERAKARETLARGRRDELGIRIAELEQPHPPHDLANARSHLALAHDRLARARASSERARQRAEEALCRRLPDVT